MFHFFWVFLGWVVCVAVGRLLCSIKCKWDCCGLDLGLRVLCMGFVKVSEKFSGDFKRVKNKGDGAIRNHKLTERK